MNRRIARPARKPVSYVAFIALIMASVAIGFWFIQPPIRRGTAPSVIMLQAPGAPTDASASAPGAGSEG